MPMRTDEQRAREREKYAADREASRARVREYARSHREERAAYTRAYRAANPAKCAASKAASLKAHPERPPAYAKAYRKRNAERYRENYRRQNLKRYGLTPQSWRVLFGKQEGLCAICAQVLKPGRATHVDHDHGTGVVRGLLCNGCNLILGHAQDRTSVLRAASHYLESHMNASGIYQPSGATTD